MADAVPGLATERLRLGGWGPAEREALVALNADPEVMRYFPSTQDRTRTEGLLDRVERSFAERGWGLWAVTPNETGACTGFVGLLAMPEGVPGAGGVEVGWRLARSGWGRGYATEAATAVLDHAFGPLGLSEVWSMTTVTNTPSQAVMGRLGMRRHASFEHPALEPDHPLRPHVVFRTTADAWRGRVRPDGKVPA
ncbi:GNAT family N-acetyltransferase [Auraticoccus monumenti]|uniref:Protein N-acetyltransferase, RimJ/RimL family n=1 Tax=Auraticoccus monumenti TaxID=675864 RepID=A0A1G7EMX6_9ACTN|nr:GNAT family N-acetyltransferase [Auraticoccus monumenti]SDE64806.1 Protein N-acetyltransferase, RimJ/RimL family [Auraticoccus monumenti]